MTISLCRRVALASLIAAVTAGSLTNASASVDLPAAGTAASRTVLTVTPSSAVSGQLMHLRAAVKQVQAGAAPTGTVTFLDGATMIGTATLAPAGGTQVARLTHGFRVGSHSLTARYGGDATYASSTSLPVTLAVDKAASTSKISVTKAAKPGFHNVVTVEKAVAPGRGIQSGTVSIQVDQFAPQAFALSSTGRAHLTLALNPGSHVAKVTYGGDSNFTSNTRSLAFTI